MLLQLEKFNELELIRKQKLKLPFALPSDESMSHKSLLHLSLCTTQETFFAYSSPNRYMRPIASGCRPL